MRQCTSALQQAVQEEEQVRTIGTGAVQLTNSHTGLASIRVMYMCPMQMWDIRSNQLLQHYAAHSGPVTNVAFHPSGDFLLSSSLDTTVKVGLAAA